MSKTINANDLWMYRDTTTLTDSMGGMYRYNVRKAKRKINRLNDIIKSIKEFFMICMIIVTAVSVTAIALDHPVFATINFVSCGAISLYFEIKFILECRRQIRKIVRRKHKYAQCIYNDMMAKYSLLHNMNEYDCEEILLRFYNNITENNRL